VYPPGCFLARSRRDPYPAGIEIPGSPFAESLGSYCLKVFLRLEGDVDIPVTHHLGAPSLREFLRSMHYLPGIPYRTGLGINRVDHGRPNLHWMVIRELVTHLESCVTNHPLAGFQW